MIACAQQKLQELETQMPNQQPAVTPVTAPSALQEKLRQLAIDELSPKQALDVLYELQRML